MKTLLILFCFFFMILLGHAQNDSLIKKDNSTLDLPPPNFYSIRNYNISKPLPEIKFNRRETLSPFHVFNDSISARNLAFNRNMRFSESLFFYNDYPFYFIDPLEPYGGNSIPAALIVGSINYLIYLIDSK